MQGNVYGVFKKQLHVFLQSFFQLQQALRKVPVILKKVF